MTGAESLVISSEKPRSGERGDMQVHWPAGEYFTLLERAAASSAGEVRLIAPFIKAEVASRLLAAVPEGTAVTIVTRWRAEEVAAGVSDLEVFDCVRVRPKSRLLLCPPLHAKLYLFGTGVGYVGSANLTRAALEPGGNIELVGEFQPVPLSLLRFAERVQALSRPATQMERDRIAAAAAALSRDYPPPESVEGIESPQEVNSIHLSWLPRFRHPAELYSLYLDPERGAVPDSLAAAAHDLAYIDPPEGLSRDEFQSAAAATLSRAVVWIDLDQYLCTARFFGPLRARLQQTMRISAEEAEYSLQTLIRWMLWVYPGRYRLEQPRHSERFGRSDGDWAPQRRTRRLRDRE